MRESAAGRTARERAGAWVKVYECGATGLGLLLLLPEREEVVRADEVFVLLVRVRVRVRVRVCASAI